MAFGWKFYYELFMMMNCVEIRNHKAPLTVQIQF